MSPNPIETPRDVSVKRVSGGKDPRKLYVRLEMGFKSGHVAPFVNGVENFIHAVVCRAKLVKRDGVFQPRPPVGPGASYAPCLNAFRKLLAHGATGPTLSSLKPLSRDEFVAGRASGVRQVYKRALEERRFEMRGLRDLSKLKGFVKVEKSAQPFQNPDGERTSIKAPRPVQPRDPAFNIELGRFTIPIEHHCFDDLADICSYHYGGKLLPVVMKCYTQERKAMIMRDHWERAGGDGRCIAIPLDQSGFDAHINDLALEFEHAVYAQYIKSKEMSRLLKAQLTNRVVARFRDGEVRTTLGPMRMSGDMNTSLGNCLISASLAWLLVRSIPNASFVVDGDDTILFLPRKYASQVCARVVEHYLEFGFDAVAEAPCDVFEQIEFCQSHPVFDGTSWRLVRNWFKAVTNDYSGFERLLSDDYFLEFMHAVGSCGMALCSGIPMLQEFYSFGLRVGRKPKHMPWHDHTFRGVGLFRQARLEGGFRRWTTVTSDARVSFWLAFGVTPDTQIAWEEKFRSMTLDMAVENLCEDPTAPPALHNKSYKYSILSPTIRTLTVPIQPLRAI